MRSAKRQAVWDRTGGKCTYCAKQLVPDESTSGSKMDVDHLISRARVGGSDHPSNLVPSCGTCNSRKGTRTVDEFRMYERLRRRDGNFRLACDPLGSERDWLMVYSDQEIPNHFKISTGAL